MTTETLAGYYYPFADVRDIDSSLMQNYQPVAAEHCPIPKTTPLLDLEASDFWTGAAREWGVDMPQGFSFNRIQRISVEDGESYFVGAHRDHPDMQGLVVVAQFEGSAKAHVSGLGVVSMSGSTIMCLSGWPIGKPYPGGRRYALSLGPNDPRSEHSVRCDAGPREAVVLTYDRHPDLPKGKMTSYSAEVLLGGGV